MRWKTLPEGLSGRGICSRWLCPRSVSRPSPRATRRALPRPWLPRPQRLSVRDRVSLRRRSAGVPHGGLRTLTRGRGAPCSNATPMCPRGFFDTAHAPIRPTSHIRTDHGQSNHVAITRLPKRSKVEFLPLKDNLLRTFAATRPHTKHLDGSASTTFKFKSPPPAVAIAELRSMIAHAKSVAADLVPNLLSETERQSFLSDLFDTMIAKAKAFESGTRRNATGESEASGRTYVHRETVRLDRQRALSTNC